MNKLIAGGLMMAGILTGCAESNAATAEPVPVEKGKAAVVYYSWSPDGNTRFAAQTIALKAGADMFEIKAEKPYPADYRACCDEAKPECYGKQLRPILPLEGAPDMTKYDVIFVGTPNWWGTMAPPVRTWVMQNAAALKGRTVCLFQTNGGGMQRCGKEFAEILPESKVLPAKAFSGGSVRNSVKELEKFVTDRVTVK